MNKIAKIGIFFAGLSLCAGCSQQWHKESEQSAKTQPNFVFFFVDDLRSDALGGHIGQGITPNIDALASQGIVFNHAYAVLSICSPSRASVLTGLYPSVHGVTTYGDTPINHGLPSFVSEFENAGYQTSVVGKWHIGNTPSEMGFKKSAIYHANGPWFDRKVHIDNVPSIAKGFIEDWAAQISIQHIDEAIEANKPFFVWHNTQVPHLTDKFTWPASKESLSAFPIESLSLPDSYPPQHGKTGKPAYLKTSRSYTRAMNRYGYKDPKHLLKHKQAYLASVKDMDKSIGRVVKALSDKGVLNNTYLVFMSDNGWFLGEHGLTSKVLAYDVSMRVPFFIVGPNIEATQSNELVTNVDIADTLVELAGLDTNFQSQGQSLVPLIRDMAFEGRDYVYYESPTAQLVPRAFFALRSHDFLYIETMDLSGAVEAIELYALKDDRNEQNNLALLPEYHRVVERWKARLQQAKLSIRQDKLAH